MNKKNTEQDMFYMLESRFSQNNNPLPLFLIIVAFILIGYADNCHIRYVSVSIDTGDYIKSVQMEICLIRNEVH